MGMIKRSAIHQVLYFAKSHGILQDLEERERARPLNIPYSKIFDWYPKYPSLEDIKAVLDPADYGKQVDLSPYLNRGGYTVPEHAALTRVYMLFRGMGLRHLPVVSHDGSVVGTITRKDLILAREEGREPFQSVVHPLSQSSSFMGKSRRETVLNSFPPEQDGLGGLEGTSAGDVEAGVSLTSVSQPTVRFSERRTSVYDQ